VHASTNIQAEAYFVRYQLGQSIGPCIFCDVTGWFICACPISQKITVSPTTASYMSSKASENKLKIAVMETKFTI
jgi:hypothetical protein